MDPQQILDMISGFLPFPWSLVAGAVGVIGYQFLKVRFPNLLSRLPHIVPLPKPTDPNAPPPAPLIPVVPDMPQYPILNAILKQIFGDKAPAPEQVDPAFLSKLHDEVSRLIPLPIKANPVQPEPAPPK